jgi:hypothetical protein
MRFEGCDLQADPWRQPSGSQAPNPLGSHVARSEPGADVHCSAQDAMNPSPGDGRFENVPISGYEYRKTKRHVQKNCGTSPCACVITSPVNDLPYSATLKMLRQITILMFCLLMTGPAWADDDPTGRRWAWQQKVVPPGPFESWKPEDKN